MKVKRNTLKGMLSILLAAIISILPVSNLPVVLAEVLDEPVTEESVIENTELSIEEETQGENSEVVTEEPVAEETSNEIEELEVIDVENTFVHEDKLAESEEEIAPLVQKETLDKGLHTFYNIVVNQEYKYSLNDKVSLTFTQLPEGANSVSIYEVDVEVEGVSYTGYEFKTNMENGTFQYEMTLPNPFGAEANVQFSENVE